MFCLFIRKVDWMPKVQLGNSIDLHEIGNEHGTRKCLY